MASSNVTRTGRVVAWNPSNQVTSPIPAYPTDPAAEAAVRLARNPSAGGATSGLVSDVLKPTSGDSSMAELMKALLGRGDGSSSLELAKFNYQKQQDAAEAARAARTLAAMQQRYTSGAYGENIDKILGMIGQQGQMAETDVKNTFDRALANIQGGYDTASRLTGEGYGALQQYLQSTPYNPYADVQVSAGIAPDAMENLLSAYGVSAEPVRAQVEAERQAAEGGAAGFRNLLGVLSAVAEAGQGSRVAELAMARNLAETGLAEQRAGYGAAAEQARANALAQLAQAMASARIDEERRRGQLADELANAIIAAGGAPSGSGGGGKGSKNDEDGGAVDPEFGKPTIAEAIQALAAAQGMPVPTDQSNAALRRQLETGFLR